MMAGNLTLSCSHAELLHGQHKRQMKLKWGGHLVVGSGLQQLTTLDRLYIFAGSEALISCSSSL